MGRKAFLLGANTSGLKFAETDVELIRNALTRYGYEVITPGRNKYAIMESFDALIKDISQTDTLIFYFSGHGYSPNRDLQLVLGDDVNNPSHLLEIDSLLKRIDSCNAGGKIVILDCCTAGNAAMNWNPAQDLTKSQFLCLF